MMTGAPTKAQETKLQGLYMHGGVGVGKTMLMDLLAHSAPSAFQVCFCSPRPALTRVSPSLLFCFSFLSGAFAPQLAHNQLASHLLFSIFRLFKCLHQA